ncbi:oligopeptidase B [Paraferrimonas sedimenticola]|uniref:Oligopeptidase B n=2 Tax=Paraferrimonas sedimenticola TaxID=375674 RepID=A0AA37RY63_9GAMM|nr:oligopeptidase B [Paraferrimonas sedimenticola]
MSEKKAAAEKISAPVAKKIPHKLEAHGDVRIDNYYWMRDDARTDAEVLAHLEAENAYAKQMLSPMADLQKSLVEELIGRVEKDDSSVPVLVRGYYYQSRYSGDSEYPVYVRRKGSEDGPEEVLLDGNEMAKGHEYFNIGSFAVSTNNELMAYSTDTLSRRIYTIEFKNLSSGEKLNDKLEGTSGQIVWANDNATVYYIKKDPQTLLGYQVYRHKLGTPQADDELVYEESDSTFYTYLGKTKDDSVIYIFHDHTTKTGASILDANDSSQPLKLFHPIEEGLEYDFEKLGDTYYVRTNWNAKNFRLMKVHQSKTADKSAWEEVIAHRDDVYLQNFTLFNDHLVVQEKEMGQGRLLVTQMSTGKTQTIAFDDEVFVANLAGGNGNLDATAVRIGYSSPTTPSSIYDVDLNTLSKTLKKQDKVLGDFDPANYKAERIFVTARDGAKVPVTLRYRKELFKKDGTNPLYQYGYGSYGTTIEPYFSDSWLSLMDRGFVVAIAHIRGSQMLGRPWYEDGKMFNKINTFNDFIDVTKGLVEQKYGDEKRVYMAGGSAGGLLMGAVMNMSPELYHGVAAHVPFVDVVTTMSDPSIPLTTNEYSEWGNPANEDSYKYMLSYSPYDQVEAKAYPHTLVTTGLHDSQVQYFEPMKWVAKLRELKTDDNMLVFDTDMEAGHGGASGRFKRFEKRAQEYAFFIHLANQKL